MEIIAPGLVHWTARRPQIGMDVSSYYLTDEHVLIDPMVPAEGLDWFEESGPPTDALLTNRHHDRDAWRFAERFGTRVHCVRVGLHELEAGATWCPSTSATSCRAAPSSTRWTRSVPTTARCTSPRTGRWPAPTGS